MQSKKEHPKEKLKLHPRNKHRGRYDLKKLAKTSPELTQFVIVNNYGDESIDFFNPEAVRMLNQALLKSYYDIESWSVPKNYLCPPIPGRADYIHHISDLLAKSNSNKIPKGKNIKCLDIGVGSNCVYPIIGNKEYHWSFIGSDIDQTAVDSANKIIETNPHLKKYIEIRFQPNSNNIFHGIIKKGEKIDLSICNPPFHASLEESQAGSLRKLQNLKHKKVTKPALNFGGQSNELWCEGGEKRFVRDMIRQSKQFGNSCFWFSTAISKQANLKSVYAALKNAEVKEVKTIPMGQGNKISRIVAWTFLSKDEQIKWANERWK